MKKFTDDMIRRDGDLPADAFALIHDLAYDHDGRDRNQYRIRAQEILKRKSIMRLTIRDLEEI